MTYFIDFRSKVLTIREKKVLTRAEVAGRFSVGKATAVRWIKKLEPQSIRCKPATRIDRIELARDVRNHPDAYHAERALRLGASKQGIGHALKQMNITYKKHFGIPR